MYLVFYCLKGGQCLLLAHRDVGGPADRMAVSSDEEFMDQLLHCSKGCTCLQNWPGQFKYRRTEPSEQAHRTVLSDLPTLPAASEPQLVISKACYPEPPGTLELLLETGRSVRVPADRPPALALIVPAAPCPIELPLPQHNATAFAPPCPHATAIATASSTALGIVPGSAPDRWETGITAELSQHRQAGKILQYCKDRVNAHLVPGLTVFKIGMTWRPNFRWSNSIFGYRHDPDYTGMVLLHRDDTRAIAVLESALISEFRKLPGCRNDAPGGEGIPKSMPASDSQSYLYLVYKVLPQFPPMTKTAAKSKPLRPPASVHATAKCL